MIGPRALGQAGLPSARRWRDDLTAGS
jgi:hypothetical protein